MHALLCSREPGAVDWLGEEPDSSILAVHNRFWAFDWYMYIRYHYTYLHCTHMHTYMHTHTHTHIHTHTQSCTELSQTLLQSVSQELQELTARKKQIMKRVCTCLLQTNSLVKAKFLYTCHCTVQIVQYM